MKARFWQRPDRKPRRRCVRLCGNPIGSKVGTSGLLGQFGKD